MQEQYNNDVLKTRLNESRSASLPAEGVEFLEAISGGLPVSVARINPTSGRVNGDTFEFPAQRDEASAWIKEYNGRENLYFSLNAKTASADLIGRNGKLSEQDVSWIRGVGVDIDPIDGRPLDEEKKRLHAVAVQQTANVMGAPSVVTDTGSGVQMLWLFPEAIAHTEASKRIVQAQARGLEDMLASDPVNNLDRLYRLPLTQNLPDERKRARGRVEAPSRLLEFSAERHELGDLRLIAPPRDQAAKAKAKLDIDYYQVECAIGDIDALPTHLAEIARTLSEDVEKAVGDATDRSSRDYRIAAYLIREFRIIDPTELASITFAVSPDKISEKGMRGGDENYCHGTIASALQNNRPLSRPEDFFEPVSVEQLTEDDKPRDMFADSGKSDDRFECLSIDDIMELPDPDYAIDRHLPQESMGFLYGEPGCGKSFVALDWALHMAYGLPDWHGDKIITRPDAQVVYLAREGSSGFKARISAWRKSHLVPVDREPRFSFIRQAIDFLHDGDIGKLERTVEGAANGRAIDMVVVDTVSRVMPGADENLQKEMTRFVSACDRLKDRFGCIVLGVHHSAKSGDMRGSSVLRGAGDFVFKLEKQKDSDRKSLICEKQKDGPDGWQQSYVLRPVSLGTDEKTGKALSSLVVKRVNSVEIDRKTAKEAEQFAKVIMPLLGDLDRVKWTDLASEVGERLRDGGLVTQDTPRRVRDEVAKRLSAQGVDLAIDGQNVNLSFNKQGTIQSAPWVFEVKILEELREAE